MRRATAGGGGRHHVEVDGGADVVIRTPDRRLRVFVSSTVGEAGELAAERRAVARAISALRLTPVLFDLGARPYPPRELYRAYLAQSDIFVGLYWQRYGRVGPGIEISSLEEELQLSAGVPRLLYVKTPAPDREPRLAALLARIKQEASDSYRYFRTPAELGRLVREDLATLLSERFAASAAPGSVLPVRPPTRALPAGTVTFLFTDIEGSTRLLQRLGHGYTAVQGAYAAILRQAIEVGGGVEVSTEGDSLFAAFTSPARAVEATVAAQRALAAHDWPMEGPLRVRMGLHTGEGTLGGDNYIGLDVHRAARIAAAGHGGQVLVSAATRSLVRNALPQGVSLRDLGRHRLRDLTGAEHLYELVIDGLAADFPPPRTLGARRNDLPVQLTSLVGREAAIAEVTRLLDRARLVTLSGPGGVGKTRLALAVAERARGRFGAGVVFVPLVTATRPGQVLAGIARALGAELGGTDAPLEALADRLGDGRWLLVLDNLEQVLEVAGDLQELLARCRGVTVLATSRTVLGLRAEQEYPVPPLLLPADPATMTTAQLAASPAMALFVDRARAVRPGFALTDANAAAVVELCRRLEGLPLAIELAAARTRLLDPQALLGRLATSLDALGTGAVDLPERQRTLRATVAWSVGLLEEDERSLLETAAVFVGGWTVDAAAQVAGLDEDRALALSEALARHSLISMDRTEFGPRLRMLETVRAFVAERLAARPDAAQVGRRHADHYRALAEQADRPLRGAGQNEWLERLEAEAGNLAAAVRWYLANDPEPLPHLFRVLFLFWELRDHLGEARAWVDQLLPTAEALDAQDRTELLWTALVIANEVGGDDAAALAARDHLAPLLAGIQEPFLHATSQLVMASISAVSGDFDGALRGALASLERLRAQDEPFWAAVAASTAGVQEMAEGRYDDALGHLTEVRDLGERVDNARLIAWSRVQLGTLALAQGRLDDARTLLDEGLDLSLATSSTRNVTLYLAAFAQLALVEGDAERAALLAGAADGLRRRAGLGVWPLLRRGEAELVAQVRGALGADRFEEVFAAGARLTLREAVATVRDRRGAGTPAP
jgi:predicted ATPase/class 3 adenylate cyclase